jgi:hypothetical protein
MLNSSSHRKLEGTYSNADVTHSLGFVTFTFLLCVSVERKAPWNDDNREAQQQKRDKCRFIAKIYRLVIDNKYLELELAL